MFYILELLNIWLTPIESIDVYPLQSNGELKCF